MAGVDLTQLSAAIEAAVGAHLNELGRRVGLVPLTWFVAPSVTNDEDGEAVLSVEGQVTGQPPQHPGWVVDQWARALGLRPVWPPMPGMHAVTGLVEPVRGEYRFEVRVLGVVDQAALHANGYWAP